MVPATLTRRISLCGHTILYNVPADPEAVLLEAVSGEQTGNRFTDPYWGLLWDAAPVTAERVLRHRWPDRWQCLELGCGVGLTGVAALFAGLKVDFSDLVPAAVRMALGNAALNGFPNADGLVLDWRDPPQRQYDLLLASDVLYDSANHEPLLNVLNRMLKDGGMVWIGDAGRHNAPAFIAQARQAGWNISLSDSSGNPLEQPSHVSFQLLAMTR